VAAERNKYNIKKKTAVEFRNREKDVGNGASRLDVREEYSM
jgi:hypothetical protein